MVKEVSCVAVASLAAVTPSPAFVKPVVTLFPFAPTELMDRLSICVAFKVNAEDAPAPEVLPTVTANTSAVVLVFRPKVMVSDATVPVVRVAKVAGKFCSTTAPVPPAI